MTPTTGITGTTTAGTATAGTASARRVTNDLDLIRDVIRLAVHTGYVLIGPREQVFRRHVDASAPGNHHEVVRTPGYEGDAVTQLLDSGHLRRGGRHTVTCGEHSGPATSVHLPKATLSMLARWEALRPVHGRSGGPR